MCFTRPRSSDGGHRFLGGFAQWWLSRLLYAIWNGSHRNSMHTSGGMNERNRIAGPAHAEAKQVPLLKQKRG